ncbi:MAG: hypothetical protein Q9227_009310 [Pyrenula ochraceoflavens]
MSAGLVAWATPQLARLLPIDDESLREIISYTASLSKEASAEHLKNLLGDSAQALEFISSFNSRRQDVRPMKSSDGGSPAIEADVQPGTNSVPASRRRGKKSKAPLHAGPARRPENYGNVTGGYQKPIGEEDYMRKSVRQAPSTTSLSNTLSLSSSPAAKQLPKPATPDLLDVSTLPSRSPSPGRQKLPPSASGTLTSDLPNVRSKSSKKQPTNRSSGTSTPNPKSAKTSSIADLTSAISALELSTNPTLAPSTSTRTCSCNATIHPLFAPAPNCLSCGKIICALEGLQPCSFCSTPLLTPEQVQAMIRSLRSERGNEKVALHNLPRSSRGPTPVPSSNRPSTPVAVDSGDESSASNPAAASALAHRDKLLAFQRENAQRTKVHDEAADFDVSTSGVKGSQWMGPQERAAALKRQQQYLREMEDAARPEWEKKKTVVSLGVGEGGRLVRTYEKVENSRPVEEVEGDNSFQEVNDRQFEDSTNTREGAFARNPLLAGGGGLVRPIWKGGKGKGKEAEEADGGTTRDRRQQMWRRVQDDNDDNEQWILDGGIRGFDAEEAVHDN